MKVHIGSRTDVGRVREGNEDSFLVQEPVFAIADGMGGHLAGDVASSTAIDVITQHSPHELVDPDRLKDVISEANSTIWQRAQEDASARGMGTTITMLVLDGGKAHIGHVGDSRGYLFRDGRLTRITEDHTLVERMVRQGRLTPEEAAHHPQRNIITNALGLDREIDIDVIPLELQPGDRVILCSDGLSSMLSEEEIRQVLEAESDAQGAADKLVQAALDAGGEDNVTVILLDVVDDDDAAEAAGPEVVAPTPLPIEDERTDTEPERRPDRRRGGGVGRKLMWSLLGLIVLAVAGYAAIRYSLNNSWFVGVNEAGFITIYRGIPEEVVGLELKDPEEQTDIALSDLPQFMRADIREGRKVDSLDEAQETVANLEKRAADEEFKNREPKPQKTGGGDNKS